jgi:putative ATP-dependent endonuclease of the OLD family
MYISKIKIQNYRGIKLQELQFTSYNTLVGKNDCGKSTIINAIKMFFNDEPANQKDFNYYIKENKNIEIEIYIKNYDIELLKNYVLGGSKEDGFDNLVDDYLTEDCLVIKKIWEYKDTAQTASQIFILTNDFENYNLHDPKLKSADINKWIKEFKVEIPVSGSGNNSDTEKKSFLKTHLLLRNERRTNKFILVKHADIKDSLPTIEILKADQPIDTTTTEFKGTFATEIRTILKDEKNRGSDSSLKEIEEKIKEKISEEAIVIKECMSHHISDLDDIQITPTFDWYKGVEITNVKLKLCGDEDFIPLENKGSGYRRLFMVGRLRYLAEKKQAQNVIYLIEEPETFLHPSAQEEMLTSLISLSEYNQIFVTTHSPIFVGATQREGITLCTKNKTILCYEQNSEDSFIIEIAKQLGIKPSHNLLDEFEIGIFIEGKGDLSFYSTGLKKLMDFDCHNIENKKKISFFFGGGDTLADFIKIHYFSELKTRHDKKLFLIIDSDKGNVDTKKIQKNIKLVKNFNQKFGENTGWALKKRYIESYYHKNALKREFSNLDFADMTNICFEEEFDVVHYLMSKGLSESNSKSNNKIFSNMSKKEWQEVSNGEFELIFETILKTIN